MDTGNKILDLLNVDMDFDAFKCDVKQKDKDQYISFTFKFYKDDNLRKFKYWRTTCGEDLKGDDELIDAFEEYCDDNNVWELLRLIPGW